MCAGKKSVVKKVLVGVLALVGLVVVIVLALPLWVGPVVKGVANSLVPKITGCAFTMEQFAFNPYTGKLRIEGVELKNPDGYGAAAAVSFKSFALDFQPGELFSKRLHITNLELADLFASYYSHAGTNNFACIGAHAKDYFNSGKAEQPAAEAAPEPAKADAGEGMKVLLDHVLVANAKVQLSKSEKFPIVIPLPTIELRDIGKASDGATWAEVWQALTEGFMKTFNTIGEGVGALGKVLGGGLQDATKTTGAAAGKALDTTTDAVKGVGEGAKKLFKGLGL